MSRLNLDAIFFLDDDIENRKLDENVQTRDAEAEITSLAGLSEVAYQRKRKQASNDLEMPLNVLDKLVNKGRAKLEAEAEAPPLYPHWMVEPWDKPVDGGILLRALTERIRRHVILTPDQATAVALWILLTWVHERAAVHSPLLLATSAEANSGKSTLLGLLGFLVRRALLSVSISGPALFRSIEKWGPTFVIDEADTSLVNNGDLKEVVNSGWTRGQSVIRCDPETNDPRPYSTFCPKAIGMKGRKLPETTLTRTIIIEMKRKLPAETVADFDHLDNEELARLRRRLARWADDNAEPLANATPKVPPGFHNRTKANWKPLFAIAESAGSNWKDAAWKAAGAIEKIRETFEASIGVQLLSDIKTLFAASGADCVTSYQIVANLTADPEKPWVEYRRGKPLSQKQLANLLNGYGVYSGTVDPPGMTSAKGYKLAQFSDLFDRYLTAEPRNSDSEPSNRRIDCGTGTSGKIRTVETDAADGSKNSTLSYSHARFVGSTVRKPKNGGAASFSGNGKYNNTGASDDQDDDEETYLGPPGDDPADFK